MPYCQQFKNQITKWEKELSEARVLLGEYLEGGEDEKVGEMREKIKEISDEQKNWFKGFKEKAKILLKTWVETFPLEAIKFDSKGRITYQRRLNFKNNSIPYFPKIIKIIDSDLLLDNGAMQTFDCFDSLEEVNGNFLFINDIQINDQKNTKGLIALRSIKKVEGDLYFSFFPPPTNNSMYEMYEILVPTLKEIKGSLIHIDHSRSYIKNLESLKLVSGNVYLGQYKNKTFEKASNLETIGGSLTIATDIKSFGEAFPRLKEVGKDDQGVSISIQMSDSGKAQKVKREIEILVKNNKLNLKGRID